MIYDLAQTKLFDIAGKTSLKSAEDADLYEAFAYLSFKSARTKLEHDQMKQEQMKQIR